ncbi:MAG TPA: L,D-transpeptidase family protein [Clostridiales bacterium]|nr:L,D-transpeptidase family protein [Clostridiales bacterium]
MKSIGTKALLTSKAWGNLIVFAFLLVLIYSLISVYFCYHFFFNTEINGVNVSLQSHSAAEQRIKDSVKRFQLLLTERNGRTEAITGQEIDLQYNEAVDTQVDHLQNSFQWIGSLFAGQRHCRNGLYRYNQDLLKNKIEQLNCLHEPAIEPENVSFKYENGAYEVIREVDGNIILKEKLIEAIKTSIEKGDTSLNLENSHCYKNPKYTFNSSKTNQTKNLLDRYVSTRIVYEFGHQTEKLDGSSIHKWLDVDENLDVVLNKAAIKNYIKALSRKYDTVGITREFKTSIGKTIPVKGGIYGWKIDKNAEYEALLQNITHGEDTNREPVYAQKALTRDGNEIGNTYVEINITRQHIWFYVDGSLITAGAVVTGNPNRGWATATGAYMLNYKQKGATLSGPGYMTTVTYWMPFYGNIGIHDASWRSSFGGEIYKRNGSHGCVNTPLYLAKAIFEQIEEGTPIICYEE